MNITADSVANEIRMKRTQFAGVFLIVEGPTDARFYKRFVDQNSCQVINAQNKSNAVVAFRKLSVSQFSGIVAVVDADHYFLEQSPTPPSGLFYTDAHDIEMTILRSPALDKILGEMGSEEKIQELTRGADIREVLLRSAAPFGLLRWLSQREGLSLKFDGLSFGNLLNRASLAVDEIAMVRQVRNRSGTRVAEEDLVNGMRALGTLPHDPWHLVCGEDVAEIISIGLKRALGSRREREIDADMIRMNLRIAYEEEFFRSTSLYESLMDWQSSNSPYRLFAEKSSVGQRLDDRA